MRVGAVDSGSGPRSAFGSGFGPAQVEARARGIWVGLRLRVPKRRHCLGFLSRLSGGADRDEGKPDLGLGMEASDRQVALRYGCAPVDAHVAPAMGMQVALQAVQHLVGVRVGVTKRRSLSMQVDPQHVQHPAVVREDDELAARLRRRAVRPARWR